ncbi:MAG TPA: hypothetical protein VI685_28675 [Candidatus Angelobacter sp.]
MSAATLEASPSVIEAPMTSVTATYNMPDALQQLLDKIEEQRGVDLRASEDLYSLKSDLERRWQIASSEGLTSSTMLYQILEYGWKEWRRIGNRE